MFLLSHQLLFTVSLLVVGTMVLFSIEMGHRAAEQRPRYAASCPPCPSPSSSSSPSLVPNDTFDWAPYERFDGDARTRLPPELITRYLKRIEPLVERPPRFPARVFTRPVPLSYNCSDPAYASLLTGEPRPDGPVRIFDFVPVSYELGTLEIRLFETNDSVDLYIFAESTHTHR
jgi:hypothetical protein